MMKTNKVLFLLALFCLNVKADEVADKEKELDAKEKDLLIRESELLENRKGEKSISDTCFSGTLPKTPRTPNYVLNDNDYYNNTPLLEMIFWREPCTDKSGNALLVRVIPKKIGTNFYYGDFKALQDDKQVNDLRVSTKANSSSWFDDLFISMTFIIDNYSSSETQIDFNKAFTLIYENQLLDIPAATITKPSIGGTASGYSSFKYSCKNLKTGKVLQYPNQSGSDWSCKGLSMIKGQTVQTIITGTVK